MLVFPNDRLISWWMRMLNYKDPAAVEGKQTGEKQEKDRPSVTEKK